MKLANFVVLGLLTAGCGAGGGMTYKLVPTPDLSPPPQAKDPNCDFVIGKGPNDDQKYDKVGELSAESFAATSADELKGSIRAQVCQLGGDYVIAAQDTAGNYKTATVLRHHINGDAGAAGSDSAVPVPNAPAPGPAPAGSGM